MISFKRNSQFRGQRGSKKQKQILILYMEQNINFAHERFEGECGALMQQKQWDDLTIMLNATDGARKSAEQWKQYWRDLKRNVKTKAVAEKRKMNASGANGFCINECQLDAQEKRIITLMSPKLFDSDDELQAKELDILESDFNLPPEQSMKTETPIKKIKSDQEYNLLQEAVDDKVELTKVDKLPESDDEFTIFGKFIVSELRSINAASNPIVYRKAKREIQQVLMATWDQIDRSSRCSSTSSYMSDLSKWDK